MPELLRMPRHFKQPYRRAVPGEAAGKAERKDKAAGSRGSGISSEPAEADSGAAGRKTGNRWGQKHCGGSGEAEGGSGEAAR